MARKEMTDFIEVVNLCNERFFRGNDSDIYFSEFHCSLLALGEEVQIIRGKLIDTAHINIYGTHGSYEYLRGFQKIFPKKTENEMTHFRARLLRVGDRIVLRKSRFNYLMSMIKTWFDGHLFYKKFEREHPNLGTIELDKQGFEAWKRWRLGRMKFDIKYPSPKIFRNETSVS